MTEYRINSKGEEVAIITLNRDLNWIIHKSRYKNIEVLNSLTGLMRVAISDYYMDKPTDENVVANLLITLNEACYRGLKEVSIDHEEIILDRLDIELWWHLCDIGIETEMPGL